MLPDDFKSRFKAQVEVIVVSFVFFAVASGLGIPASLLWRLAIGGQAINWQIVIRHPQELMASTGLSFVPVVDYFNKFIGAIDRR